ncbi:sensor histidine kinase [Nakamurella silvestris]|nr:sensor histidine kinase [Nakamurella silvestris]
MVVYGVMYIYGVYRVLMAPLRIRWGFLILMLLVSTPLYFTAGPSFSGLWTFLAVAAPVLLTFRQGMLFSLGLAAGMLAIERAAGAELSWELAVTMVALALWMSAFVANTRLAAELRTTQADLAEAAVAAERERIGRDLHDILGHSLTAITVKASLAGRLLGRDDVAARAEIADVEGLARQALADVRATASGFRDISLAGELAVAGVILRAARIEARLPQAVDGVDPAGRALFGYVVREAVTNVVRHSRARTCTVTLTPHSITVIDDGVGGQGSGPDGSGLLGSGLLGLGERVAAAGGVLTAGPEPAGGFRVEVVLPEIPGPSHPTAGTDPATASAGVVAT